MPLENNTAAPALTRRSSRLRTAAVEAPAAGATATASEVRSSGVAPLSRRAAREQLTSAQALLVAAASVAIDGKPSGEIDTVEQDGAVAPVEPAADAEHTSPVDDAASDESFAVLADPVAEPETLRAPRMSSTPAGGAEDAFQQASQAFRSVCADVVDSDDRGESAAEAEAEDGEPVATAHVARRRPVARKFVALGATVGVMSLAGLLAVSMTLPAEAVAAVSGGQAALSTSLVSSSDAEATGGGEQIQAFVASGEAQGAALTRAEDFSTVSLAELASEQGIKYSNDVFTNDPNAAIQWPFLVGVGMSSGFGPRWGRMHEGIDFVPGEGAPIQAIADGTVRIATEQGGGYGVTVYIDHVIDGQVVTSHYAHMQYGSLRVKAGQTVKVGDIVGLTGNTGHSFGAHLHFEIIINGTPIDPLPWLRKNAGRYSY